VCGPDADNEIDATCDLSGSGEKIEIPCYEPETHCDLFQLEGLWFEECVTAECYDEGCACDQTYYLFSTGEVIATCDTCSICSSESENLAEVTCEVVNSGEILQITC